jgi:hypothetical protein
MMETASAGAGARAAALVAGAERLRETAAWRGLVAEEIVPVIGMALHASHDRVHIIKGANG